MATISFSKPRAYPERWAAIHDAHEREIDGCVVVVRTPRRRWPSLATLGLAAVDDAYGSYHLPL